MYKKTANKRWFMAFLFFSTFLILSLIQPEAFSKTYNEPLGEIQWYAVRNDNSAGKYAKSSSIKLMGAFASSSEPGSIPISLEFEYTAYKELYMGIVIVNDSGEDKDVTVRFEVSGQRSGKEEEDITIPADFTYIAYIKDIFGRTGFYTFKGSIKDVGSSKITMSVME